MLSKSIHYIFVVVFVNCVDFFIYPVLVFKVLQLSLKPG